MVQLISISVDDLQNIIKQSVAEVLSTSLSQKEISEDETLTRKQTAKLLHISLTTLDTYSRLGIIKGRKVGHRVLYKKSEINDSLAEKINLVKFKSK